jgi:hypothetical protein
MTNDIQKNLVTKLCEIMAEVERIPKNGVNTFDHYNYATEADLVDAIRPRLAARNIMLFPNLISAQRTEGETSTGKKAFMTDVLVDWTFRDGDSDSAITLRFPGCGQDKGDKGVYKALTGSEKYLLMKTFLIATGDDPEKDNDEKPRNAPPTRQEPRQFAGASTAMPTPPPGSKRAVAASERAEGTQELQGLLSKYSFTNGYYGAVINGIYVWTKEAELGMMLQSCDKSEVIATCSMTKLSTKGSHTAQVLKLVPASMNDDLDMTSPSDDDRQPGDEG